MFCLFLLVTVASNSFGRIRQNFHEAQVGDLVFAYESTPKLQVTALARVEETLHHSNQGRVLTLRRIDLLDEPIPYEDIRTHPVLRESQPVRLNNRGTLFQIEPGEAQQLLQVIRGRSPNLSKQIEAEPRPDVSYLRMCTFHPAYGYEEFVEGYRPYLSEDGTPHFQIQGGIFKRLCRDARQEPDRTFVLIIDGIPLDRLLEAIWVLVNGETVKANQDRGDSVGSGPMSEPT